MFGLVHIYRLRIASLMTGQPFYNLRYKIILSSLLLLATISCVKDVVEIEATAIPVTGVDNYKAPCLTLITVNACGVNDIGNNLPWLKDIITKSLVDNTGNYWGRIWCKKYNNQYYIVTDMMLGSGGLLYHTFNCAGEFTPVNDIRFYNLLSEREIVWKSKCWWQ
jgi:hypothetical protein